MSDGTERQSTASEPGVRLSPCGAPLANSRCLIHPYTEKTHQEGCKDVWITGICVPMEHSQGAPDSSLHYPPNLDHTVGTSA